MQHFTRRRVGAWVAAVAVAGFALSACSSAAEPTASETVGGTSNELIVYSPQGEGERGEYIAQQANEELGVTINFVSGGGGELTERLLGERNNAQADVVLGLGESLMYRLDDAEIFEALRPA